MKILNKLVRDQIPEIIRDNKENPKIRILGDDEFRKELYRKMEEEVSEFIQDQNKEELADILEVVNAVMKLNGWSESEIREVRKQKLKNKGGFEKKIFLESVCNS